MEGSALVLVVCREQFAPVRFCNGAIDPKSNPHAINFRREEWFENLLSILWVEAHPKVPHFDCNPAVAFEGAQDELALVGGTFRHGFCDLNDQIEDDLLQLDPVSENRRQFDIQLLIYR